MRKTIIAASLVAATLSSSVFAYSKGPFGEVDLGGSWVSARADVNGIAAEVDSDAVLNIKAGVGYKANFSRTTPLFWGVNARYSYQNFGFDELDHSVDFGAFVGGDLSKYLGVYFKLGGEYFFNAGEARPQAAFGVDYKVSSNVSIIGEVTATALKNDNDADIFKNSGTVGVRFCF